MKFQQHIKPTFLQRIFGLQNKKNVLTELNNLFASTPLKQITNNDIKKILEKYKVKSLKSFENECYDIYKSLVNDYLTDNLMSEEKFVDLKSISIMLQIENSVAISIYNDMALMKYKDYYFAAIEETEISDKSQKFLNKLGYNLSLDNSTLESKKEEWNNEFINSLINQLLSKEKLSPSDENKLFKTAKNLNISIDNSTEVMNKLANLREIWRIENEDLTKIEVPIILNKNEFCYAFTKVDWYESRTVTKRINYAGPNMRLKIVKGLYYSAGSINVQRISQDVLQKIDNGILFLTNKRLILIGSKKTLNIKLDKILHITPYSDGIEIVKDAGRSPIIKLHDNPKIFRLILARLLNEINE